MKEKILIRKKCELCSKYVEYEGSVVPKQCIHCQGKYWDKPEMERELFIIQDRYNENGRDPEILEDMYDILYTYSERIILAKTRGKKSIDKATLDIKAKELVYMFIGRYLKYKEYKDDSKLVQSSFGGVLKLLALGVLYTQQKGKDDLSLNRMMEENIQIESLEIQDKDDELTIEDLKKVENILIQSMENIYDRLYKYEREDSSRMNYLVGLYLKITQSSDEANRYFNSISSHKIRKQIEDTETIVRKILGKAGLIHDR